MNYDKDVSFFVNKTRKVDNSIDVTTLTWIHITLSTGMEVTLDLLTTQDLLQ